MWRTVPAGSPLRGLPGTIPPMKPYLLKETNWKTIRDIQFELAILPWGATEAHNLHLPYGTDIYEADYFTEAAAQLAWQRGTKVIVLPTVPFGVNTGQADVLLDININPSTQMAILSDIMTVLNRQGIHKLLIVNSHGGNEFKPQLRELGLSFPRCFYRPATGTSRSTRNSSLK